MRHVCKKGRRWVSRWESLQFIVIFSSVRILSHHDLRCCVWFQAAKLQGLYDEASKNIEVTHHWSWRKITNVFRLEIQHRFEVVIVSITIFRVSSHVHRWGKVPGVLHVSALTNYRISRERSLGGGYLRMISEFQEFAAEWGANTLEGREVDQRARDWAQGWADWRRDPLSRSHLLKDFSRLDSIDISRKRVMVSIEIQNRRGQQVQFINLEQHRTNGVGGAWEHVPALAGSASAGESRSSSEHQSNSI